MRIRFARPRKIGRFRNWVFKRWANGMRILGVSLVWTGQPQSVFRVTDGVSCFSCESYYDHFLLRPEDGGEPWTTVELSNYGLRKC